MWLIKFLNHFSGDWWVKSLECNYLNVDKEIEHDYLSGGGAGDSLAGKSLFESRHV